MADWPLSEIMRHTKQTESSADLKKNKNYFQPDMMLCKMALCKMELYKMYIMQNDIMQNDGDQIELTGTNNPGLPGPSYPGSFIHELVI